MRWNATHTDNGCPVVRASHFVLSPTHGGFGNQAFGVEKALWVAWALNRTLIVPPLLTHGGANAFNAYPRCGKEASFEAAALRRYGKASAVDGLRWTGLVDFGRLRETGARVVDYADAKRDIATAKRTTVACGRWDARRLRETVPESSVVVVGSTLRMDLDELRRDLQRSSCGWKLLAAAHVLPFKARVRTVARKFVESIPRPFAALHLRSGDAFKQDRTEAVVAAVALNVAPTLSRFRALYVSYDLEASFALFQRFLAALCGGDGDDDVERSGLAETSMEGVPSPQELNCSHVAPALSLESLLLAHRTTDIRAAYDALLARHGAEFARIALDQQVAALSADLLLSDGAHHTFRRTSSFGRLLRRRWHAHRPDST
mmetsp:Transcript_7956/g.24576  ORF Transcript_7956/g.24576 Transcript_7956/m.24576 type:complete len:375 (-) Transcript_7956:68-1192(-)